MKKRSIIFYWLLILVPALVMSIVAFKLLSHERERMESMAIASVNDRARTVGDMLQVTVGAVEDELMESLRDMPEEDLKTLLLGWEKNNPLIRNVFIWEEKPGLKYPVQGAESTSEERGFISRFEGLFSGRIQWPSKTEDDGAEIFSAEEAASSGISGPGVIQADKKSAGLLEEIRKLRTSRKKLVGIAKSPEADLYEKEMKSERIFSAKGSWIPWFAENRLYILGWVQNRANGPVYGVELELMTLLSRLITNFPQSSSEGFEYALIDDVGQVLHQTGRAAMKTGAEPDITISLAPHLPHWELAVYATNAFAGSGRGFMILAGLLLCIFIAAIILGGALLTRQAHLNMIDARQKISFVSNVSHELKTPLTTIRMYAELLSEGRVRERDKKRHYLQVIVAESQRLTRLVNNVLDFSRLEQGRKKYYLQEIEPAVFLKEFIESNGLRIREAGLELKIDFSQEGIVIRTDRDAIEQVLLNLIDNAIKYASAGGELNMSLKADDKYCEIIVEDRGPGVPEKHQARIFEKFHRVDSSLTSKQQGAGLGLSIALRILKDLGGDIIYNPVKSGGSCFTVRLPLNISDQGRGG